MIKKYGLRLLFVFALGLCGAVASVQLGVIVMRWQDNMTADAAGAARRARLCDAGGQPAARRGRAGLRQGGAGRGGGAAQPDRGRPRVGEEGRGAVGDLLHAVPRAPPGKGDGLVTTKFVPSVDLTNPDLHKSRTDGWWQHQLSVGGPLMPAYAEALSSEERWDLVNYVRTLAKK